MPKRLDFYFDYLSPYAYFSWLALQPICQRHDVTLEAHPVVFGKLLDHWGQLGPAEIPPKKAVLYRYCYRYAQQHGFTFNPPHCHPFNPLPALRLSLQSVCGEQQHRVISTLFEAGWSHGADLGNPEVLASLLYRQGLDGTILLSVIDTPAAKGVLRDETEAAIAQGVFGVPSFVVDDELFWGNDQLPHVAQCLAGDDCLDTDAVAEMLGRHRGIDRKRITGAGH